MVIKTLGQFLSPNPSHLPISKNSPIPLFVKPFALAIEIYSGFYPQRQCFTIFENFSTNQLQVFYLKRYGWLVISENFFTAKRTCCSYKSHPKTINSKQHDLKLN